MAAAFTLYEILRKLTTTARLDENDRRRMLESIDEHEMMSVLGTTAADIECPHIDVGDNGRCDDCGRTMFTRDIYRPDPTHPRRHVPPWENR